MTPSRPLTFLASTAVIAPAALAVGADGGDGSVDAGSVRA
jgi:hypothetical protein